MEDFYFKLKFINVSHPILFIISTNKICYVQI